VAKELLYTFGIVMRSTLLEKSCILTKYSQFKSLLQASS